MRTQRLWSVVALLLATPCWAAEPMAVGITDHVDIRVSAIDYFGKDCTDVISQLIARIEHGEVTFRPREKSGYLLDLLQALDVPVESQTLVFSRTSLQEQLISPKNPRAIYFNDEVAVGWIPGSAILEIAAHDPAKGGMFYTLPQPADEGGIARIEFHREERCVECHMSNATMSVPGYLVRSIQVDEFGDRDAQGLYADVTHTLPVAKRWGGWYVTGRTEKMVHAGNLVGSDDADRHEQDESFRGTMNDLTPLVDLSGYPSRESDVVALLVLDHQMHFYNLVTRVQYEHRLGIRSDAEEQLARYALMEDEAPLPGPVASSTSYATWYQSIGSRDERGRTLRDLNLKTKLFEHGLSPLVMSRSFESLPLEVKSRLWTRFRQARGDVIELVSPAAAPARTSNSKTPALK